MPVDTSIYQPQRIKSVLEYGAEMDEADARRMGLTQNRLQLAAIQRAQEDDMRIRNALQGVSTPEEQIAALRRTGIPAALTQAGKVEGDILTRRKTEGEVAKTKAETDAAQFKLTKDKRLSAIQQLVSFQSPADAIASLIQSAQRGEVGMAEATEMQRVLETMPPEQFGQWKLDTLTGLMNAKDAFDATKPKIELRNTGGTTDTLAIDPRTGVGRVTGSVRNTQSPDNAASVGATIRGQNLTDARAREELGFRRDQANRPTFNADAGGFVDPVNRTVTPAVGGSGKPLTEGQAKAALFGNRALEAHKNLAAMEQKGVTQPGVIKRSAETAGQILGLGTSFGDVLGSTAGSLTNWTQSSGQQQVEQAQRDFINSILRRESGAVISEGEFDNARKQYFPQPGDSKAVLEQKRKNRETAIRGIMAEVPTNRRELPEVPGMPSAPKVVDWNSLQ